ncbi:hypothetical protein VOLCADRAFT_115993 [Volvox carteri f. nagariensis]|uniref:Uncharacterized protein n=1 Tax=Volvox carteri f. nagariensis TaxID=3068 RepID=D8TJC3_VOLCA|nr:uncharacterized protein VOLCADRAFT_115993 [Volvox carteri f. nagariensis]EFJ52517.1 hypothetical protein VOLCADRAFT_115993 [Volvox carteri f. nagariensis]|eukprot:XP_002946590.1 hypothetical protein VOLCADRAFT_115993 [Volvox carteri f. nagariensis]
MSVRGKEFPSFVQDAGNGYKLRLLLLLVASEYIAALQEFMTWSFPDTWAALKAQVAEHARQFIRFPATVPQPHPLHDPSAFRIWAAFTHCYFHGLRGASDSSSSSSSTTANISNAEERREATRWLHRLVGERSWQLEGPVYCAAARWVQGTLDRLEPLFPGVKTTSAGDWATGGQRDGLRPLAMRGEKNTQGRYVPVYPFHMSGTWNGNRLKFTLRSQQAPRSVTGCCGVPGNFGQTNNCALGFLVLADVCMAFTAAMEKAAKPGYCLNGREELQKTIIQDFYNSVLSSDTGNIKPDYLSYGFPSYLAACALGWKLALEQVPLWGNAAAESAAAAATMAAAGGPSAVAAGAQPPMLQLPRELPPPSQQWQLQLPSTPSPVPQISQRPQQQPQQQQAQLHAVMQQAHDQQQQAQPPPQQQQQQQQPQHLDQEVQQGLQGYLTAAQQPHQNHRHCQQPPQHLYVHPWPSAAVAEADATRTTSCPAAPGLQLQVPSLPSGGSATSLNALSGGSSGPPSVSPFVAMQQQQQLLGPAVFQRTSPPPCAAQGGFHSPPGDPRGVTQHAVLSGHQTPQALFAVTDAVPHHHHHHHHPLPHSPLVLQPPFPRSMHSPPSPVGPHPAAPGGGGDGDGAAAADGIPADTGVTSGLSNMSLDGSLLTFGDATLRLIGDEVGAHAPGGLAYLDPGAGPIAGDGGCFIGGAADAGAELMPGAMDPPPGPLLANGVLQHLHSAPPEAFPKQLIPTRTVTTLLQVPQLQAVQHDQMQLPMQPAAVAAPAEQGSMPSTAAAAAAAAAAPAPAAGSGNGKAAEAEASAVLCLQAVAAALRQLLDSQAHSAAPAPARVVRLHREVTTALENYHNHPKQHHHNHNQLHGQHQFQQIQEQHQAPVAATTAAFGGGRKLPGSGHAASSRLPLPVPAPGPGPFGGATPFIRPIPELPPAGPFGGTGGGALTIPGLAAGPLGSAPAGAAPAPTPVQLVPPSPSAADARSAPGREHKVPALGSGPCVTGATGGVESHTAAETSAQMGCSNVFHTGGGTLIAMKQETLTAAAVGPLGTTTGQMPALAGVPADGCVHVDAAGGGAGVGWRTPSGSFGLPPLLEPAEVLEGDNSLLELASGLAGGGGGASGMSWSRGGGASLADLLVSPTGSGRGAVDRGDGGDLDSGVAGEVVGGSAGAGSADAGSADADVGGRGTTGGC